MPRGVPQTTYDRISLWTKGEEDEITSGIGTTELIALSLRKLLSTECLLAKWTYKRGKKEE